MSKSTKNVNAFTVDVEDYYQVSAFEQDVRREDWGRYPSRVVQNTQRILALLEGQGVKATFFVLGWIADHFPDLIREIDNKGHEIGSHSYWHRLVYQLSLEEFRNDLCRSRDVLEDLIEKPITAYRAPSFSITTSSLWAFDILAQEGFKIDASIFPAYHHRCGIRGAPQHPYVCETKSGRLLEFPVSIARIAKVNVPMAGGGYFRLLPYGLTGSLMHRTNLRFNKPFMFYIHPWELDYHQPRLSVSSPIMRFRHYVNLSTTEYKLKRLLSEFSFGSVHSVLERYFADNICESRASDDCDNSQLTEASVLAIDE